MNAQVSLFENDASTLLKSGVRIESSVSGLFEAQRLIENFDVLATSKGGIQKLRELVLALAVRGRLVPQLATEGTSDALVTELAIRRANCSSQARVPPDVAEVSPNEHPFAIPPSWRWQRLGDLGGFLGGGTPSKSNSSFWRGSIPWVSPKDMKKPYIDDAADHISEAAVEGSAVKLIPRLSILFVVRGMILAHSFPTAMTTKAVTINQDMKALVLALPEVGEYVLRACWAARDRVLQRVERSSHGTCRLGSEAVEELPIPIPPLAEQRRIVAKVDELMRMLDALEAKQAKERETRVRFRAAALGALTSSNEPQGFDTAWKRVIENFVVLFERSESIAALRVLCLDLAVRGLLVTPRRSGRAVGVAEGAFPLPFGWKWTTVGNVCVDSFYGPRFGKSEYVLDGGTPTIRTTDMTDSGEILLRDAPRVRVEPSKLSQYRVERDDLLITRTGSIGIMAVFDGDYEAIPSAYLIRFRFARDTVTSRYVYTFLKSSFGQELLGLGATCVAQPNVNASAIRCMPLPLPPLIEQKRIVAKVEQFMGLCDELEAKLKKSESTAAQLVEAVIAEVVASLREPDSAPSPMHRV